MRPLGRDLTAAAGLAAAVVVSLVIVRVTASEPEPAPTPARYATGDAAPAAAPWTTISVPTGTTSAPAVSTTGPISSSPPAPRQSPATLVLSSGAPVNPRLDRAPRTAHPASSPPASVALTPPPDSPDPRVFADPAAVAAAWLSALCWYDHRAGRDDNTRRAAPYGDIQMPPGQDPWTFDDRAWAQITSAQTSSACTGITATVETLSRNGTDETTVTLTATQVLSAAGTAYQSVPITLTRILQRDPAGHWGIGRPVTAN
jgi:hypothetical protein